MLRYQEYTIQCSFDYDETFTSCTHARCGFENLKIVLAGEPDVALPEAYTIHRTAMTLSQVVVNMLAVVLEIKKKIVLAGVPGVALSLQEHALFVRLR